MSVVFTAALLTAGLLCAFVGIGLLRAERRFGAEPNRRQVGMAFVAVGGLFAGLGLMLALVLLLI